MKIAICLSSESRTYKTCVEHIKNFFGSCGAEIDYFIHTWNKNSWADIPADKSSYYVEHLNIDELKFNLIELYNPKSIVIEPQEKNFILPMSLYQQYSAYYANMLKSQYELANNFHYDVVVKCRMDIIWPAHMKFDPAIVRDNSCVYLPAIAYNLNPLHPMAWDRMYFGTSLAIDRVSLVFKDTLHRMNIGICDSTTRPEESLYNFFKRSNISIVETKLYDIIVRRSAKDLDVSKDFSEIERIHLKFFE